MSPSPKTGVKRLLRAPAKLNLGLEVVRRRPDGYHELATIFQAIDFYDELTATPSGSFQYVGDPKVPESTDIARPVLIAAAQRFGWTGRLELRKAIPIAAGLGGGSSNAALALRLAMHGQPPAEMRNRAMTIGADVPFFIEGGTALANGIGERLEGLPAPLLSFVVVTPDVHIPGKTGRLFDGLAPGDFSDGQAVRALAGCLKTGGFDRIETLPNAFERQMLAYPAVQAAWEDLRGAAGRVALSGAGPTVFSWHSDHDEARRIADKLGDRAGRSVFVARAIGPHHDDTELRDVRALLERPVTRK